MQTSEHGTKRNRQQRQMKCPFQMGTANKINLPFQMHVQRKYATMTSETNRLPMQTHLCGPIYHQCACMHPEIQPNTDIMLAGTKPSCSSGIEPNVVVSRPFRDGFDVVSPWIEAVTVMSHIPGVDTTHSCEGQTLRRVTCLASNLSIASRRRASEFAQKRQPKATAKTLRLGFGYNTVTPWNGCLV